MTWPCGFLCRFEKQGLSQAIDMRHHLLCPRTMKRVQSWQPQLRQSLHCFLQWGDYWILAAHIARSTLVFNVQSSQSAGPDTAANKSARVWPWYQDCKYWRSRKLTSCNPGRIIGIQGCSDSIACWIDRSQRSLHLCNESYCWNKISK